MKYLVFLALMLGIVTFSQQESSPHFREVGATCTTYDPCHSQQIPLTSSDLCMQCHDGSSAPAVSLVSSHPTHVRLTPDKDHRLPGPDSEVRLFGPSGDMVECLSCHYNHDDGEGMVIPNDRSKVCLACHTR